MKRRIKHLVLGRRLLAQVVQAALHRNPFLKREPMQQRSLKRNGDSSSILSRRKRRRRRGSGRRRKLRFESESSSKRTKTQSTDG